MRPHAGDEERLVYEVIGAFYEVYNRLEFGFFDHGCHSLPIVVPTIGIVVIRR